MKKEERLVLAERPNVKLAFLPILASWCGFDLFPGLELGLVLLCFDALPRDILAVFLEQAMFCFAPSLLEGC